jgi:hypothetical protein
MEVVWRLRGWVNGSEECTMRDYTVNKWIPAIAMGCLVAGFVLHELWGNNDAALPFGVLLGIGFMLSLLWATL